MRDKGLSYALILLAGIAAGVFAVRMTGRATAAPVCDACRRPANTRSRAAGFLGNKREVFCCPACALTAHRQSGRGVRLTEVTDYNTGKTVPPERSYFVRGSDVNLCEHAHARPMVDETKRTAAEQFDRCSPSILAFQTQGAARTFAAAHGGSVMSFDELQQFFAATKPVSP